jgi:predicted GNAT family acetyltransferase
MLKDILRLCVATIMLILGAPALAAVPPLCQLVLKDSRLEKGKIHFETSETDNLRTRIIVVKSNGKVKGQLEYYFYESVNDLHIDRVDIKKKYRGRGLSTLLLAEAVRQNPQAETISAALVEDNLEAFEEALFGEGKSLKKSAKATPAFKARARVGFGEYISVNTEASAMDNFVLRVRRKK